MAAENGDVVKVNEDIYLHTEVMDGIKSKLTDELTRTGGLTMSEIRQVLDTSRKFAIPICEYFDRVGFTIREGDKRLLGGSWLKPPLAPTRVTFFQNCQTVSNLGQSK